MKIRQVEVELYHANLMTDGQTERDRETDRHDEDNRRFSQFLRKTPEITFSLNGNSETSVFHIKQV